MPRLKPLAFTGSAELAAMIARVTPSIIELLADGVPRTKAAIVAALAGRHAPEDATLALIRLGWVEPSRCNWGSAAVDWSPRQTAKCCIGSFCEGHRSMLRRPPWW